MESFDIAVIGAGAAGMMCAAVAGQLGRRVVLIDHSQRLAEKIRISGGGRCNFTNLYAGPANYLSANPHFCRSALARYTPRDFMALLKRHHVTWHEKHKGQLFCDQSSDAVIDVLKNECDAGRVAWRTPLSVEQVRQDAEGRFTLDTQSGPITARALVVATGGLSIPKIGATDFAYRLAKQFGHKLIDTRPGAGPADLRRRPTGSRSRRCPASRSKCNWRPATRKPAPSSTKTCCSPTAACRARACCRFRATGSPASRFTSTCCRSRTPRPRCSKRKPARSARSPICSSEWVPQRLAHVWLETHQIPAEARVADLPDKTLRRIGEALSRWTLTPNGTEGYRKAEVTRGGIDTRDLSSSTMMSARAPGLYFIGEAVDVTGWLGGYNFQWAWASGVAAGQAAAEYARGA